MTDQPMTMAEVRRRFPDYDDMDDLELANALHGKFYSDIPLGDFYAQIGYTPEGTMQRARPAAGAAPATPARPTPPVTVRSMRDGVEVGNPSIAERARTGPTVIDPWGRTMAVVGSQPTQPGDTPNRMSALGYYWDEANGSWAREIDPNYYGDENGVLDFATTGDATYKAVYGQDGRVRYQRYNLDGSRYVGENGGYETIDSLDGLSITDRNYYPDEAETAEREAARRALVASLADGTFEGTVAAPKVRSLGERFVQNAEDGFRNSPISQIASALEAPLGFNEEMQGFDAQGLPIYGERAGGSLADFRREENEAFQRESAADTWNGGDASFLQKTMRGVATLGGQFAGQAADPVNLIGPKGTGGVVGRMAREAGYNVAVDAAGQGLDLATGVQDEFSVEQSAAAAAFGAALPAVGATARKGADAWATIRSQRPEATPTITPEQFPDDEAFDAALFDQAIEAVAGDTDLQRMLVANGAADANPEFRAKVEERLTARRAREAAAGDVPSVIQQAVSGGMEGPVIDRLRAASEGPNVAATTRSDIEAALLGDIDPGAIRAQQPRTADAPMIAGPDGIDTGDVSLRAAADLRSRPGANALVPYDAQPSGMDARMTPEQIAQAQRAATAGNVNGAEPVSSLIAPEGRLPQTPDGRQQERQSGAAFDMADRQRGRLPEATRDTQTGGMPRGPEPMDVLLNEGFPVRVVGMTGQGARARFRVERYDPRTGQADPDGVPYEVMQSELTMRSYQPDPRMAQDFGSRDSVARTAPELPRMAGEGVRREPTRTFQATAPDAPEGGNPFPGANGPDARPPLPEQPEGPGPFRDQPSGERRQRARDEEELRQRYERAQQENAYESAYRAQQESKGQGERSTNTPADLDGDGRYPVNDAGFVRSTRGGPIIFDNQIMAARWIVKTGHANSADQIFELANHPTAKGKFTVLERGRADAGTADPGAAGKQEGPEAPASPGDRERAAEGAVPALAGAARQPDVASPDAGPAGPTPRQDPDAGRAAEAGQGAGPDQRDADPDRADSYYDEDADAPEGGWSRPGRAMPDWAYSDPEGRRLQRELIAAYDETQAQPIGSPERDAAMDRDAAAREALIDRRIAYREEQDAAATATRRAADQAAGRADAEANDPVSKVMNEVIDTLAEGKRNAILLPPASRIAFEARLAAEGWKVNGEGERATWTRDSDGADLFLRSQGPDASVIVQFRPYRPEDGPRGGQQSEGATRPSEPPPEAPLTRNDATDPDDLSIPDMPPARAGLEPEPGSERVVSIDDMAAEGRAEAERLNKEMIANDVRRAAASTPRDAYVNKAYERAPDSYMAKSDARTDAIRKHRAHVEETLLRGEDVPDEVIRDYRDLLTREQYIRLAEADGMPRQIAQGEWDYQMRDPGLAKARAEWAAKLEARRNGAAAPTADRSTVSNMDEVADAEGVFDADNLLTNPGYKAKSAAEAKRMAVEQLDELILHARQLVVRDDMVRAYVTERDRMADRRGNVLRDWKANNKFPRRYRWKMPNASGRTSTFTIFADPAELEAFKKRVTGPMAKTPQPGTLSGRGFTKANPDAPRLGDGLLADLEREVSAMPDKPAKGPSAPIKPATSSRGRFYSGLDPEAVVDELVKPAARAARQLLQSAGARKAAADLRKALADIPAAKATGDVLTATGRVIRAAGMSNAAAMNMIAAKYPDAPALRQITDMVATDPGTDRVIGQTFQRAVEMRSGGMANRLVNIIGVKGDPNVERDAHLILTGRKAAGRPTDPATKMARGIRNLLDEQYDYLRDAGLDLGYVRGGYFPRVIDEAKVEADPEGFKAKAAEAYRRAGADSKEARELAGAWHQRIFGVATGTYDHGAPTTNSTKGRVLPKEADRILADFYQTDVRATLLDYFNRTARAAEFNRRFGKSGEKLDALFDEAEAAGVSGADIRRMREHLNSSAGLFRPDVRGEGFMPLVQTVGILGLLPKAALSSLVEGVSIGIRSHSVWNGLEGAMDGWREMVGAGRKDDMRVAAEMIGVVGDAVNDLIVGASFGGDLTGKGQQKVLAKFFRANGLHAVTQGQRMASFRIGHKFLDQLLKEATTDHPRKRSSTFLLRELGINEADAPKLAAWMAKDKVVPLAELMGTGREATLYRTAQQRFADEAIQNPTAADRPLWSNHPVARNAYGIMSFLYGFTRNVLNRTMHSTYEGVFKGWGSDGYTMQDRARFLAPMASLALLSAAQVAISEQRDKLLNRDAYDQRTEFQQAMVNLDRSGVMGSFSPLFNTLNDARYSRDLDSLVTGAYLSNLMSNVSDMTLGLVPSDGPLWKGQNAPSTENAEWRATKAAYDTFLAPLVSVGTSQVSNMMPNSPLGLAGKGASGAAMWAGTGSKASSDFANLFFERSNVSRKRQDADDVAAEDAAAPPLDMDNPPDILAQ